MSGEKDSATLKVEDVKAQVRKCNWCAQWRPSKGMYFYLLRDICDAFWSLNMSLRECHEVDDMYRRGERTYRLCGDCSWRVAPFFKREEDLDRIEPIATLSHVAKRLHGIEEMLGKIQKKLFSKVQ